MSGAAIQRLVWFVCPICYREIKPTTRRNIPAHVDTIGEICLGIGQPFEIAVRREPEYQGVEQ